MKKNFIWLVIALFIVFSCKKTESPKSTTVEGFKFKVKVVKAEAQTFQKFINYKGTVYAWQTANIMPEISGRIARIYKNVGEEVKSAELLADLDLTALKLQQKQAEAAQNVADKGCQDAKLNHERMAKLFDKNAVSSFQLEKAQLSLAAAQTQLDSTKATLDIIRYTLDKSHMRAPFAGVISAKNLQEGDMVNPSMGTGRPVLELLDLSQVKVVVDLTAQDIERVNMGQACRIKLSGTELELQGKIFSKSLAADPVSKTFRVEIAVPNPEKNIRANVFADVWIEIEKKENVLTLPLSALLADKFLMVVENGKAKKIEVKAGAANDLVFIVEQGISTGQIVIVEGNYDLQDGQDVIF